MCVNYIHSKLRHGRVVRMHAVYLIYSSTSHFSRAHRFLHSVHIPPSKKKKKSHIVKHKNPYNMMLKLSLPNLCEHVSILDANSLLTLTAQSPCYPILNIPIVPSLALPLTGLSLIKFYMASKLLSMPLQQMVLAPHLF